jgi:hypothetical protein
VLHSVRTWVMGQVVELCERGRKWLAYRWELVSQLAGPA